MKKGILLAVLALFAMTMQAQVTAEVSEPLELMSILSKIAGFEEYNMDMAGQYTTDTEAWFAPFKDHPMIGYFQRLRENYGIAYNAPAGLGVNLEIEGGKIKMVGKKELLDDRWFNVDLNDFVARLNQFYNDTRFHEFFQQHETFYTDVLQQYQANVMKYFNQDWYSRFYGTEPGEIFRLILGFTNGGSNYAATRQIPGQPKESFSICGYWTYPQMGSVLDPQNAKQHAVPTLIHEFNHSFVNPLQEIEKNAAILGDIPQRLLEQDVDIMSQQAYPDPKTVFNESVVRAATVIYMMKNGFTADEVESELMSHVMRGFKWTPELVTALRDYTSKRNKYPTLGDFYPQIAKVLKNYLDAEDKRMDKTLKFKQSTNKPSSAASQLKAEAMESVELMGVLSRLAGYQEYNMMEENQYIQDVDNWFGPFKDHPVIEYYQGLRQQYGIAYDAPMSLATRLAAENGKIVKLQEESGDTGLDGRWNQVKMSEFLDLLNQFYTDTRFHYFYQKHQPFYLDALKAFNEKVMPYVHPEWFAGFYGKPSSNQQKVVMGFATRDGGAYGTVRHLKGQPMEYCPVVCYYGLDKMAQIPEGMREATANMITGMLSGSVDQSSGENLALLGEIGTKLLSNNLLLGYNYGINDGQTLINKSLEEAANIIFMMENGSTAKQVGQKLASNISSGFSWMPELVNALRDYTSHRNKYKTLNDFYPQIAKVMGKYLVTEQKRMDKALK
jgi:hypothetical protein